jgi:hypothetical protein
MSRERWMILVLAGLCDPPAIASLLKHLFSPFTVQFERGRHHFLVSCCNLTKALGRQIPILDFAI